MSQLRGSSTEEPWELFWEAEWDELASEEEQEPRTPPEPTMEPEPEPPAPPEPTPGRARAARRRLVGRWARWATLLVLAAMVGALAAALWPHVAGRSRREPSRDGLSPPGEQVVAWIVRSDRPDGPTFVAVLAAGGKEPPLALAIPAETITSVPGHDVVSVEQAADSGDAVLMATVVENLVGVHVQESLISPVEGVGRVVEPLGRIRVDGRPMGPKAVVRYLDRAPVGVPEGLFRWEVVLAELLPIAEPEDLEALPEPLRSVFRASAGEPVEVIGLPVTDAGSGVVVPDQEAVAELVAERFGGEASPEGRVRLVLLNGNGTPGIGAEVAEILVPEGFRVVESGNARTFDMPQTLIIASSEEDLAYARKAHLLLGTGRLLLGEHPTGLADVTVVIGEDFGGA
jgi:hypothetical protein